LNFDTSELNFGAKNPVESRRATTSNAAGRSCRGSRCRRPKQGTGRRAARGAAAPRAAAWVEARASGLGLAAGGSTTILCPSNRRIGQSCWLPYPFGAWALPCLDAKFFLQFHYVKRRFPITSKCRHIYGVLNVDEIKN
jgi:hypothetical protein